MITSINEFKKIEIMNYMIDISCAALAQIKIDDKYLLFKEKQKYQPIGGGLKYTNASLSFLDSINFNTIRTDNDLRIQIPKDKWNDFENWFKLGKDREISINREIKEELGQYVDDSFLNKLETNNYTILPIITDKHRLFQIHKITFDIHVKNVLINLVNNNDLFILATKEEILNEYNNISGHSQYIL